MYNRFNFKKFGGIMLELKNINFERNGHKILNNINLKFENNKFIIITGPNGSGKSTLAKIIMGIEKPDSGAVIFNEQDITNLGIDERANLGISFAFQTPVRFKGITVYDLLNLSLHHEIDRKKACNILLQTGLCARNYLDREVNSSLSGGELKRIEIASVLARKPKLCIFDEPEAGIDLWSFQNLIEVFTNLKNNTKNITIIISHQERILNIADEIIMLEDGKVKLIGDTKAALDNIMPGRKCCKGVLTNEQCGE